LWLLLNGDEDMKKILSIIWLACAIIAMPVVYAADEAPKDQKNEQKATGDKKDGKAGESGEKKKDEPKGGGSAEPECS
jgi:Ni/Co efflux regulator RcnB